ncbi:MAG: hypothetical protein SVP52_08770, partial [Chloroflexota bacterium]|nr:hypothetical protein [Chloroflexota bacterium]
MPVNLLDIQKKLRGFGAQALARKEKIAVRQKEVVDLIKNYANRLDQIKARVNYAADVVRHLRCALPVDEPLDTVVPIADLPEKFTVMAADGSQINPSRHARVAFCVINVGLIKMVRGSGMAPEIYTQSQLLDYDSLFTPSGVLIS